jgi:Domain of unknown function (DUF4288)
VVLKLEITNHCIRFSIQEMQAHMSNWYLVQMNFEVRFGQTAHTLQHHTQWRLLKADSKKAALKKAAAIGTQEGQIDMPPLQGLIRWHYVGTTTIIALQKMSDGAELLSHTSTTDPLCRTLAHEIQ